MTNTEIDHNGRDIAVTAFVDPYRVHVAFVFIISIEEAVSRKLARRDHEIDACPEGLLGHLVAFVDQETKAQIVRDDHLEHDNRDLAFPKGRDDDRYAIVTFAKGEASEREIIASFDDKQIEGLRRSGADLRSQAIDGQRLSTGIGDGVLELDPAEIASEPNRSDRRVGVGRLDGRAERPRASIGSIAHKCRGGGCRRGQEAHDGGNHYCLEVCHVGSSPAFANPVLGEHSYC